MARNSYSVTRQKLISALAVGNVLWWGKSGPRIYADGKERHPRRDTVKKMIRDGVIAESNDANDAQRSGGERTYRIVMIAA